MSENTHTEREISLESKWARSVNCTFDQIKDLWRTDDRFSGCAGAQHSTYIHKHLSLLVCINKQRMRSTAKRPDARTKEMGKTRRKNNSQNSERRRKRIANEWAGACARITAKQWCKSATPTSVCRKKVPVPRNAWLTEWDWEQTSGWASVRHANLFMELSAKTVFFCLQRNDDAV